MANLRQRRKKRSSSYKPVSRSRHVKRNLKKAPPIRGPKIIQDAWNNHRTVRQNYAALGLIHTLTSSASGGVEPLEGQDRRQDTDPTMTSNPGPNNALIQKPSIPKGFGKIVRDGTGNIVQIEMAEEENVGEEEGGNTETLEPEIPRTVVEQWITGLGGSGHVNGNSSVVEGLEQISTSVNQSSRTMSISLSGARLRHCSVGEQKYLERLVEKYGTDTERMSRDRKLNPEQRTAGALRRALKRGEVKTNGEDR